MLARVRAALGRKGPDDVARAAAHAYIAARHRGPRPALPGDLAERFLARATDMASTVERVAAFDAVTAAVGRYVAALDGISADKSQDPRAGVCWPEFATLGWRDAGLAIESRPTVGHDAIGITGCFCAIAETGTLVFLTGAETPTARSCCPRRMSRSSASTRSCRRWRTRSRGSRRTRPAAAGSQPGVGPSRTGDIEQTIVLGAHGPRRLHIVLVG